MSKKLVAYFSASGTTARAAQSLAKAAGHGRGAGAADLGELVAQLGGVDCWDLQVHIFIQLAW